MQCAFLSLECPKCRQGSCVNLLDVSKNPINCEKCQAPMHASEMFSTGAAELITFDSEGGANDTQWR